MHPEEKMAVEPRLVAAVQCRIGENPLWHPEAKLLFFLDIAAGQVHVYDPATGGCRIFSQGPITGGMTLQDDGNLLLFQDGRVSILGLDGIQREVRRNCCPGNERFNDVIADPEGRVYAGAMGGNGRLLRFDPDGAITELFDGVGVPNGMGFTPDGGQMYFTDSIPRRIYLFDYERRTGALSNRRVFTEIPRGEGVPDGMTIDADGYVCGAVWFGGRVKRFAPDGRLDREVFFPVAQTSAMVFGGADYADAYITSAATNEADSLMPPGYDNSRPRGGGLYSFRMEGVKGTPLFRSRLRF
jgi:D-xylono/L-arabinono-1,4-lactonase